MMKPQYLKRQPKLQQSYTHLKRRLFDHKSLILSEQLPYQVIATFDKAQVRYYASQHNTQRIPLVLVAPLAIKMSIYDLFPYRSLVRHLSDNGFDVYLIDWGKLDRSDVHLNFEYFVFTAMPKLIQAVKQHANCNEISLQGWSMAGIFSLMYAASGIDSGIRNLLIFGSPVDSHASGNIGRGYQLAYQLIQRNAKANKMILNNKVPAKLLHTPGFINALGFKLLNPLGMLQGHLQLLKRLNNLADVKSHATLSDFLNNMIDYPGAVNQDMLLWIWLQNPMIQGKFTYKGRALDLKNIQSSLLVGAGDSDSIVTAPSIQPLTTLTSSTDVAFQLIPGGHLGLMCSQGSSTQFWPVLTEWLRIRSSIGTKNTDQVKMQKN
ncbi:MAG: alpha/beta fold hydrolase [Acinetobacter sp.]|nr:MAG: alpha/beta fold hydrolase [Acinetobacter sp.]